MKTQGVLSSKKHPYFSKFYFHFFTDIHGIFRNFAIIGKNLHTCIFRLPQSLPKRFIRKVVGMQVFDSLHLDHKKYVRAVAFGRQPGKLPQVLGTPLRGRIRESTDTVIFQCHTFNFQKAGHPVFLKRKVKAGIPVLLLCL